MVHSQVAVRSCHKIVLVLLRARAASPGGVPGGAPHKSTPPQADRALWATIAVFRCLLLNGTQHVPRAKAHASSAQAVALRGFQQQLRPPPSLLITSEGSCCD
jgi:hypothetical protein